MSNYMRFVSYLYEYKDGTKSENRGFVKVEARDNLGKIEIHIKAPSQPANIPIKVYGFVRKDSRLPSILLGTCNTGRTTTFCKLQFNTENIAGTEYNFSDLNGLLIFCDNNVCYGTSWDDHPIIVSTYDDITPAPASPEPVASPEVPAEEASLNAAETETREDSSIAEDTQDSEEVAAAENQTLSTDAEQLSGEPETTDELSQASDDTVIEELLSKPSICSSDDTSLSETAVPTEQPDGNGLPDADSEENITSFEQHHFSDNGTFSDDQPFPGSDSSEEQLSGEMILSREQHTGNMLPPPIPRPRQQNMTPLDTPRFMGNPMPFDSQQPAQMQMPYENQQYTEPVMDSNMPGGNNSYSENWYSPETLTPPARPAAPMEQTGYQYQSSLQNRTAFDSQQHSQAIPMQNYNPAGGQTYQSTAETYRQTFTDTAAQETVLQQPELQSVNSNSRWQQLCMERPNVAPFQDDEIIECIQVDLKDLEDLRQDNWVVGNNQFLLHAYSNYQHLIIGKINRSGEAVYVLGVPGNYDSKEKFMANMFGFPYFKSCQNKSLQNGEFGYWYRPIS